MCVCWINGCVGRVGSRPSDSFGGQPIRVQSLPSTFPSTKWVCGVATGCVRHCLDLIRVLALIYNYCLSAERATSCHTYQTTLALTLFEFPIFHFPSCHPGSWSLPFVARWLITKFHFLNFWFPALCGYGRTRTRTRTQHQDHEQTAAYFIILTRASIRISTENAKFLARTDNRPTPNSLDEGAKG